MKKILASAIISALVAFVGANVISKTTKFKWEMILSYEHISNSYDVDFSVLSKKLNINPLDQFDIFMQKLDARVSLYDSKNPCSKVRSSATQPNILVSLNNIGQLIVMIRSADKKLLLECETFIDSEMVIFEKYTNAYILKIIEDNRLQEERQFYNTYGKLVAPVIRTNKLKKEQERLETLLGETVKNIIESNKDEKLSAMSMKELSQALQVFDQIASMDEERSNGAKRKFSFDLVTLQNFDIIKKQSRQMIYKKDSTKLLGFSIYIILQSIFLIVFFSRSTYAREAKIKKKIYNFFN